MDRQEKIILTVITGPRNQYMKRKRYNTLVKKTYRNHHPPPAISETGTASASQGAADTTEEKTKPEAHKN